MKESEPYMKTKEKTYSKDDNYARKNENDD